LQEEKTIMFARKIRYGAAALAAAAGLALAASGPALAAPAAGVVNGPFFSQNESGYEIHSSVQFNQERATFCVPAGATSSVGLGLQETVNGGETVGLILFYNAPDHGYYLEYGAADVTNTVTGTPLFALSLGGGGFTEISTLGTPAGQPLFTNVTGGCAYLEVRQSTLHGLVNLVEGPSESDAATLATIVHGVHATFHAPFIGVLSGNTAGLAASKQQMSVTRNGVTEPAGHNVGGIAGTRVTFDFFATDETEATLNGGSPTINPDNPVVLENSPALPGTGSAFGVVSGS
jgi:hypothetical protein